VLLVMVALVSLFPALSLAQEQAKIRTTAIKGSIPFSGHELYTELCAVCHGVDGRGGGPAATALTSKPTDLTQLAKQTGGKFPSLAVRRYIEGADSLPAHGSRDMPI
jgi:mono/diheme cytochrome c family protein